MKNIKTYIIYFILIAIVISIFISIGKLVKPKEKLFSKDNPNNVTEVYYE